MDNKLSAFQHATREAHAQLALTAFMTLWRRGFIVYQYKARLFARGGDPTYERVAAAMVRQYSYVLAPRTPHLGL